MAYSSFILAQIAALWGMEAPIFFTFRGFGILNKKIGSLKIASVGNPALPMPNILGMLLGMTAMATSMLCLRVK